MAYTPPLSIPVQREVGILQGTGSIQQETIDLSVLGDMLEYPFKVAKLSRVSVSFTATPWNTAIIEWKWSVNGDDWFSFAPTLTETDVGGRLQIDTTGIRYLTVEVTQGWVAAGVATIDMFGDNLSQA